MKNIISSILLIIILSTAITGQEKNRIAVMDIQNEDKIINETSISKITDYIFTKFQSTGKYWMIPKSDRDSALQQAIEETMEESRKQCVDEKCQLSMTEQLQANFLVNTKIKELYTGTCQISISIFDVEKRAGTYTWENKFDCTEKELYKTIDSFYFGGNKSFQTGIIEEEKEEWNIENGNETIIKFNSSPAKAFVLVDGKIVCQSTPCSKMLTLGKHEISMQIENYQPANKIEIIKKGMTLKYNLEANFGWITVKSEKPVEIILDGMKIGKTPINKKIISPGAHKIQTAGKCYYSTGENFIVNKNQHKKIDLKLTDRESAVKVSAQDEDGNDIEADIYIDENKIGITPGTYKIPLCSSEIKLVSDLQQFKKKISLKEKTILPIKAVMAPKYREWSERSEKKMIFSDADSYCEELIEKGKTDWRMPSVSELRQLIKNCPATVSSGKCKITDYCVTSKCSSSWCNGCGFSSNGKYSTYGDTGWFWTSTHTEKDKIWAISFYLGFIGPAHRNSFNYVRCVR